MRKFLIYLLTLLFLFILPSAVFASEKIDNFTSNYTINNDGTVTVYEIIDYDFGTDQRRGIFREIPYIYRNDQGKSFKLDFDILSVTDEQGKKYKYKVTIEDQDIVVRIGDEDKYLTGKNTYKILYKVSGAIRYFSDHDELYWNATGNNWDIPIINSSALVNLNFEIKEKPQVACFTEEKNISTAYCDINIQNNSNIEITSARSFNPGEGLTFAVGFPKNLVSVVEPEEVINFWDTFLGKIVLTFLIILAIFYYFISPVFVFFIWYKYGRDPKTSKPVSAWYEPPKDSHGKPLLPAEVGTLVDEQADSKDISSTIVDLAIRGYFKIKEVDKGKNYELIKTNDGKIEDLSGYEKTLIGGLFKTKDSVTTSSLKSSFYTTANNIEKELYENLVKRGFFPHSPKAVRDKYYIFSGLAFMTGNIFLGFMLIVFGRIMPRKTIYGAVSQTTAYGLRNFLSSQTRQLKFQAYNWNLFEKLLPYAIVFGVEKIWAERFKELNVKPPSWYEGTTAGGFNSHLFINNLNSATRSFSTMSTPPSSTRSSSGFSSGFSSGSSGGGFGGGGGGSW